MQLTREFGADGVTEPNYSVINRNESHIRKDVHPEAVEKTLSVRDEPDWLKKLSKDQLSEPGDIASIERHSDVGWNVSESRCGSYQLNRTSETGRVERPMEFTNRDKELKLLNEIKERLNTLHDQIRGQNVKEHTKKDEPSLCALSEQCFTFGFDPAKKKVLEILQQSQATQLVSNTVTCISVGTRLVNELLIENNGFPVTFVITARSPPGQPGDSICELFQTRPSSVAYREPMLCQKV
ncbi:hypothetical protein OROGR_013738 [Orobanche gracilis]